MQESLSQEETPSEECYALFAKKRREVESPAEMQAEEPSKTVQMTMPSEEDDETVIRAVGIEDSDDAAAMSAQMDETFRQMGMDPETMPEKDRKVLDGIKADYLKANHPNKQTEVDKKQVDAARREEPHGT